MFAVNSVAIEKFIAANQEQLHATGTSSLEVPRDINFFADLYIDSDPRILFLKRAVLPNLPVKWKSHANLVSSGTQCSRQPIHDIDNRSGPLERRAFCANHENSHSTIGVFVSRSCLTNTHVSPTQGPPPECANFPRVVVSQPPRESR